MGMTHDAKSRRRGKNSAANEVFQLITFSAALRPIADTARYKDLQKYVGNGAAELPELPSRK